MKKHKERRVITLLSVKVSLRLYKRGLIFLRGQSYILYLN